MLFRSKDEAIAFCKRQYELQLEYIDRKFPYNLVIVAPARRTKRTRSYYDQRMSAASQLRYFRLKLQALEEGNALGGFVEPDLVPMGKFRIVIEGVGNHYVDRNKKQGEVVDFKEQGSDTPDLLASEFVKQLQARGATQIEATITQWPDTESEVVDNLVTGIREKKPEPGT